MKERPPIVRQTAWLLVIPELVVLSLLVLVSGLLFWRQYGLTSVMFGILCYLAYGFASRRILLKHHRRGLAHTRRGDFTSAIREFEESYQFFSKHPWIDRHRYLTMLMPANQSFREMALINTAYCYALLEDAEQSKATYQRALEEFPDSIMAKTALDFIETIEKG
jgi:tetratricopeptide (TPR) repeat protein